MHQEQCSPVQFAKMSKICPELTPVRDEGEAALRSSQLFVASPLSREARVSAYPDPGQGETTAVECRVRLVRFARQPWGPGQSRLG